ncbi:DUF309 domain-containing protein [Sporosarcina trichiuri]|uniref:DUF309 domain-containing protein n=1 Tax=Sporosarcina trichiuri TaxID=3056445 RepID=UPI0025B61E14|nr:DUF309 domain-containing protein [Sporosarcina sp. 0.2-SM1T-5]WJY28629.1 DUF309 domain-containing protein [Sporosarcina sp. 0.2-SM1T-5]
MQPYHHPLFVEFLVYFNRNQDYFEGHEVLEEYWKSVPGFSKEHPLTAFILLTTGMYHWRRGNFSGASRTFGKSSERFAAAARSYPEYREELDIGRLLADLESARGLVQQRRPFRPFPIIVLSQTLLQKTEEAGRTMTLLPRGSEDVVHKHMRRDRSDILELRNEKKKSGR